MIVSLGSLNKPETNGENTNNTDASTILSDKEILIELWSAPLILDSSSLQYEMNLGKPFESPNKAMALKIPCTAKPRKIKP